jgi:predicted nucleic acid-binding protein
VAASAVVDASPLIHLAKGGYLELLRLVGDSVAVPVAVANEIRRRGPEDLTAHALDTTPWLIPTETPAVPPIIQAWDLGPGESGVLAYAYVNTGSIAIIDDLAARRCAEALRIALRGTLGLVLIAKKRGVLPAARPVLLKLKQSGMYLSDRVLDQALALIGE